jgi:hypothetical protein
MQYWIEQKSAKASYIERPGLIQLVEKKGKRVSPILPIICRPQKSIGPTQTTKLNEINTLYGRFAVAPMMDWTGTSQKRSAISA